jgi:Leucine-rich repeat (LRR) protein
MASYWKYLRFSLKAFLVLLTIFCVWLGKISIDARRQKEAVAWIESLDGFAEEIDPSTGNPATVSTNEQWWRDRLGEHYFARINYVYVYGTHLNDISMLTNLPDLEEVELWECNVKDISALSSLKHLKRLYLDENHIADITPLTELDELTALSLSGNRVSDISALANLRQLEELYLDDNQICDIEPLRGLPKLWHLQLPNNRIRDLSPVEDSETIENLVTHGNPASAK